MIIRCLLTIAVLAGASLPAAGATYGDALVVRARALALHERREWQLLLHYRPRAFGRTRSAADDPAFFNSPRGATDPAAELEATLRSFFSTIEETDSRQNPQCRFIARYRWLRAMLDFDPARLPERPCARYERWRARLAPSRVTLVFPTAYLNSPASMYGHTLLRIDGSDQNDRTRLLAYAINFAAQTDEGNGLVFAWRGLTGGYAGRFSMMPYYVKVAEYSDLESRDIWEYELDLAPARIDRMLEHVWELGPIRFDYYFLDENCSYQLLSLLDVARPDLNLTERFPLWAIPADTVRAVTDVPGLVRRVVYRPARSTELTYRAAFAPPSEARLARTLAAGEVALDTPVLGALPTSERARVLELAYDELDYRRLAGKAHGEDVPGRLRDLLVARSRLPATTPVPTPPEPTTRPDQGHRSARLSVGAGTTAGDGFQELQYRGAYHDLLDPEPGYRRGSQIEFGNIAVRHENDNGLRLERVGIIDVNSIAPRDALLKPVSWQADFGFERTRAADESRPLLFQASGGVGLAQSLGDTGFAWAMVNVGIVVSGRFDPGVGLGAGLSAGLMLNVTPRWRLLASARSLHYAVEGPGERSSVALGQSVTLAPDLALRIEADVRREFGVRWSTIGAYLQWYFQ
ncbi:MAG: DUF4105 domain-containing protein [Betaproteobacteria bacterium]